MIKIDNSPFDYSLHTFKLNDKFEYSSHIHEYYELIYFIQGNAIYSNEEKSYRLTKGDLVITRPFSYHCITFDGTYTRVNIMFDAKQLANPDVLQTVNHLDVINCNHLPAISDIMNLLEYYKKNTSNTDFPKVAHLLIEQIFWTLSTPPPADISLIANDIIDEQHILAPILQYINDNLALLETIDSLCQTLHISESYLHKLFRKTLKTSPAKYIHTKRLMYAKQLLELGKKPTEICYECGYNDYSTFYRNYVKLFGVAPRQNIETSAPVKLGQR